MTTFKSLFFSFLVLLVSALLPMSSTSAAPTKIKWLGHAAFEITTPKGHVLLIDPWVANPKNPDKTPLSHLPKVDYILITHGHFDHVGDAVAIAKQTGAHLVTNYELGTNLIRQLGFPKDLADFSTLMNIGGEISIAEGEVTVAMTPAVHSSGLDIGENREVLFAGNPSGFVLKIQGGPSIYHTGDTSYFSDMKLIGETYSPDIALINAGGHFGMGQKDGAKAAKAVHARLVIPHHFGTFPVLASDTKVLFHELDAFKIAHRELAPGEEISFEGTNTALPR